MALYLPLVCSKPFDVPPRYLFLAQMHCYDAHFCCILEAFGVRKKNQKKCYALKKIRQHFCCPYHVFDAGNKEESPSSSQAHVDHSETASAPCHAPSPVSESHTETGNKIEFSYFPLSLPTSLL